MSELEEKISANIPDAKIQVAAMKVRDSGFIYIP
jgi:hypothetical protein